MNNHKLKILYIFIFILATFFTACNKDEINEGLTDQESEIPQDETLLSKDQLGLEVAKNLAKNLSNAELRDFIKAKALEAFDGDYNFLIETSKNENITNKKSGQQILFSNFLSEGDINDSSKKSSTTSQLMNSIKVNYPLLQIALPEFDNHKVADWDTESSIPLVAYLPLHIKDDVIPAYDVEGNYYQLSASTPPENLVIVVKQNERVTVLDKSTKNRSNIFDNCEIIAPAFHQNDTNEYHFTDDLMNQASLCSGGGGGSGGGGTGGGSGNTGCDRDRKSGKDRLNKLKFNSMPSFREIAEWHDGAVELELTAILGTGTNTFKDVVKRFNGRRGQFKNCSVFNCNPEWFDLYNTEIDTWDKDIYGDKMLYIWVEKDGGGQIPLKFSLSTKIKGFNAKINSTITIKFEDDEIGQSIIEYCDNTDGDGYTYNTGLMKFQVRQ
ncbi:hypothetical protein D1818_09030 [Aquimarina sp. BL5]|uniref:hypothetical protein n=1 Tax=Aquimarina sp. BL5 TaxID=1714860 RepID=UPI000E4C3BBE|nr:hypothetical protein [Aquimarina sp. BL5]AXT50961.1 hypothetical protein D1818_09030 [Aquimarina sp. BL5]RKN03547.1 hypothetical protein D7036_13635 [Aquimarina sp. BL5]